MKSLPFSFALALLGAAWAVAPVHAQQQQQKSPPKKPPVIVNDPSLYRPPPSPHERTYVGPSPATAPPMQRVPQVPPLSQPPIR
jgi:hypothetical protein